MKRQLTIALKLTFILAAVLVVNACKNQKSSVTDVGPTGVYALVSIDGSQVPANVFHEGTALKVRSGTFTINADGTCSTKTIFVPSAGSEVTRMVYATYTKDGSRLNMQWKGAGKTVGSIEGDTFTMNNEGMVFVYKR